MGKKKTNIEQAIDRLMLLRSGHSKLVIGALKGRNTGTNISNYTGLVQPVVSKVLTRLYKAGLVTKKTDKNNVMVWYTLDRRKISELNSLATKITRI